MFLLSKTCYSLLAFARFEWLLSVLFCFRWNYSVSHFYDVSKKHLFYSWVFLSISFVFLSIVSRFLCNFLDVMQFSRCNLLLHIFSDFFVSLRRPFNHIFVYALSSSPRLPRTHLKLFCKRGFASLFGVFYTQKCLQSFLFLLLKVEPSKLNSSLFSP